MFCGNCGTKSKKGDVFCSECGSKLVDNQKEVRKTSNNKKNIESNKVSSKKGLSKGILCLIISASVLVVAVITYIIVGMSITDPKNIAKDYINAVVNKDSNKLYNNRQA